ncbi:hypothetical protein ACFSWD_20190 [Paenibacillus xanthanilyticus]
MEPVLLVQAVGIERPEQAMQAAELLDDAGDQLLAQPLLRASTPTFWM